MIMRLFETFNVLSAFISLDAVLALHSFGRTTGLVVESGENCTYTVPILEGSTISHAIQKNDIGGSTLVNYASMLLKEMG